MLNHAESAVEYLTKDRDRLSKLNAELVEALKDVESKIVDFEAGKINWRPDDFLHRVRAALKKATS